MICSSSRRLKAASTTMLLFKRSYNERKIMLSNVGINAIVEGTDYDRPALLCLPGALGSGASDFGPQISALRDHFKVVAWDPPGYGKSRPPERNFAPGFFRKDAELAHGLMQALNHNRYSILGWSDGGITALIMAAKYPESVDKMVVWGANAYVTEKDVQLYEGIRDIKKWSENMRKPFVEVYGELHFQNLWNGWIDTFQRFLNDNSGDICTEVLKDVSCPVLLIHGGKDPLVPEEHPKFLKSRLLNSHLVVVPDGKHNLHFKYAKSFCALVTTFLNSNDITAWKTDVDGFCKKSDDFCVYNSFVNKL